MRRIITTLLVGLAMAATLASGEDESIQVFSGTYNWKGGGSDELKAEFRPTEDGNWKVQFGFRFSGKRNSWTGTATGSLEDGGKISGTAGSGSRSWEFVGTVKAGVLRGSHTEILRGGDRHNSGSFEIRR